MEQRSWHRERRQPELFVDSHLAEAQEIFAQLFGKIAAARQHDLTLKGANSLCEHALVLVEEHVVLDDWSGSLSVSWDGRDVCFRLTTSL